MQEQQKMIEALKKQNETQQKINQEILKRLEILEKKQSFIVLIFYKTLI